jgi:hypothetical protein
MRHGERLKPRDKRSIWDTGADPKCCMCPLLANKVVIAPLHMFMCIHCFMKWTSEQPEGTVIQSQSIIRTNPLIH